MRTLIILVAVLLLAAAGREMWARRAFAADGPAFRCRFRRHGPAPQDWPQLSRLWSRHMWARWSGGLLVIRRGPLRNRTLRLVATVRPAGVYVRPGSSDVAVKLVIQGANVEMTAAAADRLDLVGPFIAAAVRDLPTAPTRG